MKHFEKPLFSDQGYPVYMLDFLEDGSFTTKTVMDRGYYGMKDEKTFFVIHDAYGRRVNDNWMRYLLREGWLEECERVIWVNKDKVYLIKYPYLMLILMINSACASGISQNLEKKGGARM